MSSQVMPFDYSTPQFPSLYPPLFPIRGEAKFLFYTKDVLRFTLYWTLILYAGTHLSTAFYAVITQWRNWRMVWAVPLLYTVIAGFEGLLAGSVAGLLVGLVYEAGSFKMSTWIPFVWGCINTLVLILSSFSIQGGI